MLPHARAHILHASLCRIVPFKKITPSLQAFLFQSTRYGSALAEASALDEAKPADNHTSFSESPRLWSDPASPAEGVDPSRSSVYSPKQFASRSPRSWSDSTGPAAGGDLGSKHSSPQSRLNSKLEKMLQRQEPLAELLEAYEQAKRSGVAPNQRTLTLMLACCDPRQDLDAAMQFVRECQSHGVALTTLLVNQLLRVASFADMHKVCEIVGMFESHGLIPNATSYDRILRKCLRNIHINTPLRVSTALATYHQMKRSQLELSPHMKRDLLVLLAHSGDAQHAPLATELFASLQSPSTNPQQGLPTLDNKELHAHDAVLYLNWRAGDMETFAHLYDICKRRGLRLDHGCYIILLNHAARLGDVARAEEVWHDLVQLFGEPRRAAHHALLHTYAQARDLPKAFATLEAMEAASVACPPALITMLADACGSTPQELDRAYEVLLDLKDAGRPVSIHALNAVIEGCSVIGDLNRAYETFDEAHNTFALRRTTATYNALLRGYSNVSNHVGLRKLYVAMMEDDVDADNRTHDLLMHSYCSTGNLAIALEHFRCICRPSMNQYMALLIRIINSGAKDLFPVALELLTAMQRDGFPIPGALQRAIVIAKLHDQWAHVLHPRKVRGKTSKGAAADLHADAATADRDSHQTRAVSEPPSAPGQESVQEA